MNQIFLLSIRALNSPYKVGLNLIIYLLIYFCFYLDFGMALCMNTVKTSMPEETKDEIIQTLKNQIASLTYERNLINLENKALKEEITQQEILNSLQMKRTTELERENLKLNRELEKDRAFLQEVLQVSSKYKKLTISMQEQLNKKQSALSTQTERNMQLTAALAEAKLEINTLKRDYFSSQTLSTNVNTEQLIDSSRDLNLVAEEKLSTEPTNKKSRKT